MNTQRPVNLTLAHCWLPLAVGARVMLALAFTAVSGWGVEIPFVTRTTGAMPVDKIESMLGGSGVSVVPTTGLPQQMGVGWVRTDLSWLTANPGPGVYDWTEGDTLVNATNAQGLRILIMVRNTPAWAATTTPYEFDTPGKNDIPQGEHWVITPSIDAGTGYPSGYNRKKYSNADGSLLEEVDSTRLADLRMSDPNDFRTFIRAMVARYSAAPFNVKYFQICNEHRPESGQYPVDSTASVAERWFVPAAEEIHANFPGVKVMVSWPVNVETSQIDAFEAVPGALQHMDIYAQHYTAPPLIAVKVFSRYAALGRLDMSFWSTEYGSIPTSAQPWKVGHDYPAFLGLFLQHDWADVDKFKVFWWPYSGSANPPQALVTTAGALTDHGRQVRTLHSLLSGATCELATGVTASPDPAAADYFHPFKTDRGIVAAIGLANWSPAGDQVTVSFASLPPARIRLARSVDPYGNILETLTPQAAGTGAQVTVNVALLPSGGTSPTRATVLFVEVHTFPELTLGSSQGGATLHGVQRGALEIALLATGGTAPYTWSVTAGALPNGLTLNPAGLISGTPTAVGTIQFTVQATDSADATATQVFTLTILPEPIPPEIRVLASAEILLAWPAVAGFRYQVEYSPDLSQWLPIGTPTLATGTGMTWTDDGSETASLPASETKRFYRLRISE